MKVLVVAATSFELGPFPDKNNTADILITGVGIPATVYHLTRKLLRNKYDLAIQAGIAGSFTIALSHTGVVIVKEDTFGDIGINENQSFKTLFETPLAHENDFPFTRGWLVNPAPFVLKNDLPLVKGITVNSITDDAGSIEKMVQKFKPDIETMEGAGFHYVCLQQKVPFLQIRGISNMVGERDKEKWETQKAIANLRMELEKIIQFVS